MDQKDLDLLKIVQDGVQLTMRPYQVLGDQVGISEQEVIERLRALQEAGIIRRFAATIGHRALGIVANAMIAWKAAPDEVDKGRRAICQESMRSPTATKERSPRNGLIIFTPWYTQKAGMTA